MENLRTFVENTDAWLQWLSIILISAIPFIESYFGAALGVLAGVPLPVAIIAAVIGNWLSMAALVILGARMVRDRYSDAPGGPDPDQESSRRRKLRRYFDRYGVPGVSLLGQTVLPSQITSTALVAFGAGRNQVIAWQTVSIIIWGVAFGLLAQLGYGLAVG